VIYRQTRHRAVAASFGRVIAKRLERLGGISHEGRRGFRRHIVRRSVQGHLVSWSDHPLPSNSVKNAKWEPGAPSGPSCWMSEIGTPWSARAPRPASMSFTTSCMPLVEPGSPSGNPSKMTIERGDPGGVSPSPSVTVTVTNAGRSRSTLMA
jgi:hypothetical protein